VAVDVLAWRELSTIDGMPQAVRELLPATIDRYRSEDSERQRCLESLLQRPGPWIDVARTLSTKVLRGGTSSVSSPAKLLRYPLLLPSEIDRDRVFRELWNRGLGASRLYRTTLDGLPRVDRFVTKSPAPNAADFAKRVLTLPLHSDVRLAHFEQMTDILHGLVTRTGPLAA
jgi:hypothetical protein